jgi:predicted enzyme related to lactoylglutathione lyase
MNVPTNALAWFEIPTIDFDRAKSFYEAVFEYEIPEAPMPGLRMGIFPHERENGVGGAIIHHEHSKPSDSGTVVYLSAGEDLQPCHDRAIAAGATEIMPKTEIGQGMGFFSLIRDTEGNHVGLYSMG